jgi:hypothetical protein
MPHKLAPHSTECVLGFPDNHKGYRCLDLSTNRIIISHHVIFDENQFPFAHDSPAPLSVYNFLDDTDNAPEVPGIFPMATLGPTGPSIATLGTNAATPSTAAPTPGTGN